MPQGKPKRRPLQPTDDWKQLKLLCSCDEQVEYERIRPLLLFGESVPKRAQETNTSQRTLYRRISGFQQEGMHSLFGSPAAKKKRRVLPNSIRRLIVDLKAEHPALNNNEIANICYVFSGRKPDIKSVGNILEETPIPLKVFRRFRSLPPDPRTQRAQEGRRHTALRGMDGQEHSHIPQDRPLYCPPGAQTLG